VKLPIETSDIPHVKELSDAGSTLTVTVTDADGWPVVLGRCRIETVYLNVDPGKHYVELVGVFVTDHQKRKR